MPINYDNNSRMKIDFPGDAALASPQIPSMLIYKFVGEEGISKLFSFELSLISETNISPDTIYNNILGKNVTVTFVKDQTENYRYFNGIISSFTSVAGFAAATGAGASTVYTYTATMVPKLWLLTRNKDSKIFQNKSVPEIIVNGFLATDKHNITYIDGQDFSTTTYLKRDYCSQYMETDYNFISRIMEDEGIYYYFIHEATEHTMVMSNILTSESYLTAPPSTDILEVNAEMFLSWEHKQEIRSKTYTLGDYDFTTSSPFYSSSTNKQSGNQKDIYEYPGAYTKYDATATVPTDKMIVGSERTDRANMQMDEEEFQNESISGSSFHKRFTCGYQFIYKPTAEKNLLISVNHDGSQAIMYSDSAGQSGSMIQTGGIPGSTCYMNGFKCMRTSVNVKENDIFVAKNVNYHPLRITPKSVVKGPQTAIVVRDDDETTGKTYHATQEDSNVYTDSYGRVKVRFHWERSHTVTKTKNGQESNVDAWNDSAWVRVGQTWAGAGWGSMHIPHVGQEVIVDFLEGDPDRPVITGRVYNGTNQPDSDMNPATNPHVSGFRDEYGNRLIFNATKDKEGVLLETPKDKIENIVGSVTNRVVGDFIEIGAGTKLEGFFGASVELKCAMALEMMFGRSIEFFMGNKAEYSYGVEYEHKHMKDLKDVEGDIKIDSGKDHILTAKDGFCAVGGNVKGTTDKNAIINAFGDGIMLSFGNRLKSNLTDAAKIAAEKKEKSEKTFFHGTLIAALIGAVLTKIAEAYEAVATSIEEDFEADTDIQADPADIPIPELVTNVITVAAAIVEAVGATIIAGKASDTEEPLFHKMDTTDSLLGLNENGVTIGVGPSAASGQAAPGTTGDDAWKDYLNFVGDPTKTDMKSKIMVKKDGAISIDSNGDNKEFLLNIGTTYDNDTQLTLRDLGSTRSSFDLNCGKSRMYIYKNKEIVLNNSEGDANSKIELISKGDVVLKSKGGGNIVIDGVQVQAKKGTFETANIKDLG